MRSGEYKPIYILLTKYNDWFSKTVGLFAGCEYMHASIGLEDGATFFSFNTKRGFCIEMPFSKARNIPCILYRLDVPGHIYEDIALRIQPFINDKEQYKFNYLEIVLCILHMPSWRIPRQRKTRYFCSQFVSELLHLSGAATLKKNPSRFLPKDFSKDPQFRLCYQGALMGLKSAT